MFQPTFGNRPDQYIGRDGVIEQFQLNGSIFFKDDKRKWAGVTAGALGFTIGHTFGR